MITWAPFIDTAYHTSVYRISDYQALDDYLPFFERSMRKVLSFVDLLFLCVRKDVEKTRDADREFLLHLLESRGQDGRITVVDTWNRKKAPGYRKIVDVGG